MSESQKNIPYIGIQTDDILKRHTYVCGRQNCDTCNKHITYMHTIYWQQCTSNNNCMQWWSVTSVELSDGQKITKTPKGWYSSPVPRYWDSSEQKLECCGQQMKSVSQLAIDF